VTADQGGHKNRNEKTIAVFFLPCFLLVAPTGVGSILVEVNISYGYFVVIFIKDY
jgi:hypothetical protein